MRPGPHHRSSSSRRGFLSTSSVSATPGSGFPVRWSTTRKSTGDPPRSPARSWSLSTGLAAGDSIRGDLPTLASERAAEDREPGRAHGQDDRRGGQEGRGQLELRHDHRPEHAVGQLDGRRRSGGPRPPWPSRRGPAWRPSRRRAGPAPQRMPTSPPAGQRGQPGGRCQAAAGQAVACSFCRARSSRPRTLPAEHRSRRAASSCVRPSR